MWSASFCGAGQRLKRANAAVITQGSIQEEIDGIADRVGHRPGRFPTTCILGEIVAQLKANALREYGTLQHTFDVPHTFT